MSEHKIGKGIYSFLHKQFFMRLTIFYALYRMQNIYIPNIFLQNCNHKRGYHSFHFVNNGMVKDQVPSFYGKQYDTLKPQYNVP